MSDTEEVGGFVMMPRWLQRDREVSWQAKMLYLAINSRLGRGGSRSDQQTLADDCGMSVRAVQRAQAELTALGVLEVTETKRQDGRRGCNRYRLLIDQTGQEPAATQAAPLRQGGVARDATQAEQEVDLQELEVPTGTSASAPARDDDFEDFWRRYPRHAGSSKADARKAYGRAIGKVGKTKVLAGTERFRDDPNLPEERFIPHASTWLNQERWDSEPLPARGGQADMADLVAQARARDEADRLRGIGR